jgi:hypothetical protein
VLGWPRELTWGDFATVTKPKPMPAGAGSLLETTTLLTALTAVRVTPSRDQIRTSLGACELKDLKVTVDLDQNNTWVIQGKATSDLLNHEQGHYNIAGLIARELHYRLKMLSSTNPCQLQDWVNETTDLGLTKGRKVQSA